MRDRSDPESSHGAGILVVSGEGGSWIVASRCCHRIRSSRCTIEVLVLRDRANHTRFRRGLLLDDSGNFLATPTRMKRWMTGTIFGLSLLSKIPVEEWRFRRGPRECGCEGSLVLDPCPNPRLARMEASSMGSISSSKARLFSELARLMWLFSMPLWY